MKSPASAVQVFASIQIVHVTALVDKAGPTKARGVPDSTLVGSTCMCHANPPLPNSSLLRNDLKLVGLGSQFFAKGSHHAPPFVRFLCCRLGDFIHGSCTIPNR